MRSRRTGSRKGADVACRCQLCESEVLWEGARSTTEAPGNSDSEGRLPSLEWALTVDIAGRFKGLQVGSLRLLCRGAVLGALDGLFASLLLDVRGVAGVTVDLVGSRGV